MYAFATDGQEAHSTGVAQNLIGVITAMPFTVTTATTATALNSDTEPATVGATVTLTATVTHAAIGLGDPTPARWSSLTGPSRWVRPLWSRP